MKKILTGAALCCLSIAGYAQTQSQTQTQQQVEQEWREQEVRVPQAVQNVFEQEYPGVQEADWSNRPGGAYHAQFEHQDTIYSVTFNVDGGLKEKNVVIDEQALPSHILEQTNRLYPQYTIISIEEGTDASRVYYKANLAKRSQTQPPADGRSVNSLSVYFDEKGNVMEEEHQ
jgi:hypothetical protein